MNTAEFESKLKKYAEIAIKIGVNLQPGQKLWISALTENAELVYALTESAYEAGARMVSVGWVDERISRIRYEKASLDSMEEVDQWLFDGLIDYLKNGDAFFSIYNPNPDLTSGIDPEMVGRYQKARAEGLKEYSDLIKVGASNWAGVSAPTAAWAAKVLPDLPEGERIEKLWELIFEMCRVNRDDPVAAWKSHLNKLKKWHTYFNDKQFDAMKLTGPGTDLTIGMPQGQVWRSGAMTAQNGVEMVVNIPTEEVFSMPHRERIDGVVRATKPLNYIGYSDKFSLTFEKGKIVDLQAEEGEEHLRNILKTDEGANYIGEIALVPHSSSISASGKTFYNILYDENASSHMAIGGAYRFSVEGGEEMSEEQFKAAGGNESNVHADFMIGSGELDVDGIGEDGTVEPVMRAGEFVMEL
ncbi:MAG: aminopeptidase [Anaerolineae bacterium]|nr:aminopeptidase [Anaerolineae bacterium]